MLHKAFSVLDRVVGFDTVSAHCDIPCKIYDPIQAQLAVLTVIRMVDLIAEQGDSNPSNLYRLINEKEVHGKKVKDEVVVIWGDYFKQPQFDAYPQIHELTHSIMLLASKAKQNVDRDVSLQLLDKVNEFAEIFWATKNISTYKATSPYPPALELVYPKLTD